MDNFRIGYEAGALLAEFALSRWDGKVDWMLGLDIEEAGPTVQSRITGAFEGVKSRLPNLPVESFVRIDGRGMRDKSCKVVLDFLKRHPRDKHIMIAAANDTSALGAIAAIRELGRERHVAVVGQDCLDEMANEMRRPGSPAIGSVSHEANQYGPRLIELGLALLRGEKIPPYNYVDHQMITADRLPDRVTNEGSNGSGAVAPAAATPVARRRRISAKAVEEMQSAGGSVRAGKL